ncbi:serine hydrolase [Amycolatopsis jiangsuensis]|uniref:Beta-lactamase class A catalytic domain-containing protein n=1 Tax=Amycolatopsis jiangsuensis TaxID=1181879 RepID=A0A840IP68_9PSEU|nr:serine hydrolase [Amycolatopsis jiangsuensis]MBB4683683.1 hypothetical protein [Amycolatopsis jiangsuensis]
MVAKRGARRRASLCAVVLAFSLLLTACGQDDRAGDQCADVASDVGSVEGWVGYLAAHPSEVALVVDDGRGHRVRHRPDEVQPMASASKALNLVAYARAVASGAVSPDERVRVGDWERWAVRGGGEDAHAHALDHLGVARNGARARDPEQTVSLDQLVNEMMIWSDNAAPDFLRDRLGDRALAEAAETVGWHDAELPSTTGLLASFFTPELLPASGDRAARRKAEWEIARRYAHDAAFRADVDSRQVPAGADEPAFVDGGPGGTAAQLASLWSAIGHGSFPGADVARRISEQKPHPRPGIRGIGVKGGSTTGILARGTEVRRDDGTVGVAVLLVHGMTPDDTAKVTQSSQAFNDFLTAAVQDPATTNALECRFPGR